MQAKLGDAQSIIPTIKPIPTLNLHLLLRRGHGLSRQFARVAIPSCQTPSDTAPAPPHIIAQTHNKKSATPNSTTDQAVYCAKLNALELPSKKRIEPLFGNATRRPKDSAKRWDAWSSRWQGNRLDTQFIHGSLWLGAFLNECTFPSKGLSLSLPHSKVAESESCGLSFKAHLHGRVRVKGQ